MNIITSLQLWDTSITIQLSLRSKTFYTVNFDRSEICFLAYFFKTVTRQIICINKIPVQKTIQSKSMLVKGLSRNQLLLQSFERSFFYRILNPLRSRFLCLANLGAQ